MGIRMFSSFLHTAISVVFSPPFSCLSPMNENEILLKIFQKNIQINENKYTITTQHGNFTILTNESYPQTLPEVQFNFFDKTNEDKIKNSNFYKILTQFKDKHCIYPIIYLCMSIIEDKHEREIQVVLQEIQEIDDKMFLEWKASKTKAEKVDNIITGKMYFQKIADKKTIEM